MPYRRRTYRKRKAQKRYIRRQNRKLTKGKRMYKASIQRVPGLAIADRTFLHMAYTLTFQATYAASGNAQFFAFSGTNLNDPSLTLSASRPSGYTQWSALYNTFRVYGSKISAKFMSAQDPTLPSVMRVVVVPHQGGSGTFIGGTSLDAAISQKYSKNRVYNATTSFPTINHSIGVAKMAGVNKESVRDEYTSFSADFTSAPAGPNNEFVWMIGIQPLASTTTTVNVQVRVIYTVELYNRKEFAQP